MFRRAVVAILLVAGIASACGGSGTDATRSEGSTMSGLSLASATFADGGAIPARHSCDGADVSPPLAWSGVPGGTRAFALIVDDRNDFGRVGWGGPCPPSGTHRYVFELSALDRPLGLTGSPTAADVRRAMTGHVLGSVRLTGTYRRGG